jgi:hypothetical protein
MMKHYFLSIMTLLLIIPALLIMPAMAQVQVNWQALKNLNTNIDNEAIAHQELLQKQQNFKLFQENLPEEESNTETKSSINSRFYSLLRDAPARPKTPLNKPQTTIGESNNNNAPALKGDVASRSQNHIRDAQNVKTPLPRPNFIGDLNKGNLGKAALQHRANAPARTTTEKTESSQQSKYKPLAIEPSQEAVDYFKNQEITELTANDVFARFIPQKETAQKEHKQAQNAQNLSVKPSTEAIMATPAPAPKSQLAKILRAQPQPTQSQATPSQATPSQAEDIAQNEALASYGFSNNVTEKTITTKKQTATKKQATIQETPKLSSSLNHNLVPSDPTLPKTASLKPVEVKPVENKPIEAPITESTNQKAISIIPHEDHNDNAPLVSLYLADGATDITDHINHDLKASLSQIADQFRDNRQDYLIIRAYGDDANASPSTQKRLALSRAKATRNFLKNLGLRTSQIQLKPIGHITEQNQENRIDIVMRSRS